jgi:nucleoside-triphosphatase THEP1
MAKDQGFPGELLERSTTERIAYFERFIVSHPTIQNKFNEIWETVLDKGSYSILYVFGPTGVGKTTLFTKVIKELMKKEKSILEENKTIIPFLGTRAIAPESGNFEWKDFYIRTLEQLKEPLIGKKVLLNEEDKLKYGAYHKDNSTKAYRKSIENALIYRKTSVFLIDEAQHLAKITSGKKILNQMDVIKSLATETDTLIILFGTYGLQNFLNLSDQLSRRGHQVHFPRYRYNNKNELQIFEDILWSFQCNLPLKKEFDMLKYSDFFYERSLGCVGILKDWIERTFRKVLSSGKEQLSIDDFNKYALTINQCLTIAEEIINGEKDQEETENGREDLQKKIGMSVPNNLLDEEPHETKKNKRSKKSNKNVGERKPKRDNVGTEKYA